MTREEIKNTPEVVDCLLDRFVLVDSRAKLHKRLEEVCDMAIKALEEQSTLDKIRAEILEEKEWAYADFEQYKIDYLSVDAEYVEDELPQDDFRYGMERCVEIIDKYRK